MNASQFLKQALKCDIRLSVHGDKLDVDAPKDALTPDVIDFMRQHKPEIVEALTAHLQHGSCYQCGTDTECMLTRPDGSWDWQCIPCFDRGAMPLPKSEKSSTGDSVSADHG